MNELRGKKILILSPQEWGSLNLSKHHYAIELAKRGNQILFVDVPLKEIGLKRTYKNPLEQFTNLILAVYQHPLPFRFSFYLNSLYQIINLWQIKQIIKETIKNIDICIDFGHYRMFKDMRSIEAKYKIFFPVDDSPTLTTDSRGANICFTVSRVIMEKMNNAGVNCHFINHGLPEVFAKKAAIRLSQLKDPNIIAFGKIKVGYSGNLMIPFLNRFLFRQVVESFHWIEFHCFGRCMSEGNNPKDIQWQEWLHIQPNVLLYGVLDTIELEMRSNEMHAFWLCYQPDNKNYHAENSHKILEYLSTGKVIISTPISIYNGTSLLETAEGSNFILCFGHTISALDKYNSLEKQKERILFALENTYQKQIGRIESYIYENI